MVDASHCHTKYSHGGGGGWWYETCGSTFLTETYFHIEGKITEVMEVMETR